jgi:4-carboxymuconolactone decarboxylase
MEEQAMAGDELFEKGLKTRKQVLGAEYVDANLAGSDEFMMTFQRAVTELAWGYAWSRPGLEQKTRSILTLGILAGLGRFQELGIYTNAALSSGVTINELKEILVHITAYCGTPAGRQSFLAANETLKARKD